MTALRWIVCPFMYCSDLLCVIDTIIHNMRTQSTRFYPSSTCPYPHDMWCIERNILFFKEWVSLPNQSEPARLNQAYLDLIFFKLRRKTLIFAKKAHFVPSKKFHTTRTFIFFLHVKQSKIEINKRLGNELG